MSVRALKEYPGSWEIDFKDEQGKRRRIRYTGTETQARQIEHSFRIRTKQARPLGLHPSLAEAAPDYLEYYALDHLPKGTERTRFSLKPLLRLLGRYQFPSLTGAVVEDYKRTRMGEGVSASTINKELAALSGFAKWANEHGYCERIFIKRFPSKLARAPFPNPPSRRQAIKFLRALPRQKRGIWAAMFYCGLRISEARNLREGDINWGRNVMVVCGKGNKQRVVPLHRKLLPYLHHLPFDAPNDLRAAAKWAAKRAGIDLHIHPHIMRHAFGVHMVQSGVSLRAVQEIMGHSSSQVTEIYTRLAAEWLVEEMKKA